MSQKIICCGLPHDQYMGKTFVQKLETVLPLGALVDAIAVIGGTPIDSSRANGVRILDLWMAVSFTGHTVGEGPILYGLGRDLESVTLLKEALEADPQGFSDKDELEKTTRNVMVLGYLSDIGSAVSNQWQGMRKIKFPWKLIPEGSDLQVWAFNRSGATLTTGTIVAFDMVVNQEWLV